MAGYNPTPSDSDRRIEDVRLLEYLLDEYRLTRAQVRSAMRAAHQFDLATDR